MARGLGLLVTGIQGGLGKQIVVKHYSYGVVVTKFPDMSSIKPSELQKEKRSVFSEAVAYARSILRDPVQKAAYKKKIKKGQTVYHAAIREFLAKKA
ncbi:MAG: hypothetical protein WCF67_12625 [Chitinophagaceae bacterium]